MITACFITHKDLLCGFTVRGHSGYSESGTDIICASVSAMVNLTARFLDELGVKCHSSADAQKPEYIIQAKNNFDLAAKAIGSFYCEASAIADEYPEYLRVIKQEKTEKE